MASSRRNGSAGGGALQFLVWNDQSVIYEDRIGLLMRNAAQGLGLVLLLLGLFLKPRLAFWVTMGIPISFLGVFLVMPALDVSINMISLFSFILVLGIVVDDAIVVGEAAFHREEGATSQLSSAVLGAREVRTPVIFAVTTTILVFVPMLGVPGVTGEFFAVIPMIVIPILVLSLVESLLILPAHIAHLRPGKPPRWSWLRTLLGWRNRFSDGFERWSERFCRPAVRLLLSWRSVTLAASLVFLAAGFGLVGGERLGFVFLPKIEGKIVRAQLEMPSGTSFAVTEAAA